ncbi:DUF6286 domain-containing protein [Actinomycetes bacterium M1A6_2h]
MTAGSDGPDTSMPPAGRIPHAPPAAAYTGVFVAAVMMAGGLVGIHDGIVGTGWISGPSWTRTAVEAVDGLATADWMVAAGIALAVFGLWWIVLSIIPRRRNSVRIDARTLQLIEPKYVARIASETALSVTGVLRANAAATLKEVAVSVDTTGDAATHGAVTDAVRAALAPMSTQLKIIIHSRTGGTL